MIATLNGQTGELVYAPCLRHYVVELTHVIDRRKRAFPLPPHAPRIPFLTLCFAAHPDGPPLAFAQFSLS